MSGSRQLYGTRVVVTGATSGLGAAMADALLEAGATVAMAARPGPRLNDAVRRRAEKGLDAEAMAVDVRDHVSVDAAALALLARWGSVDIVVNNAGIGMRSVNPRFFDEPRPFFEVTPEAFTDLIATNLTGYFLVARAFARALVEQGHGRVVNISMNHETMRRRGFVPIPSTRHAMSLVSALSVPSLAAIRGSCERRRPRVEAVQPGRLGGTPADRIADPRIDYTHRRNAGPIGAGVGREGSECCTTPPPAETPRTADPLGSSNRPPPRQNVTSPHRPDRSDRTARTPGREYERAAGPRAAGPPARASPKAQDA